MQSMVPAPMAGLQSRNGNENGQTGEKPSPVTALGRADTAAGWRRGGKPRERPPAAGGHRRRMWRRSGGCQKAALASAAAKVANEGSCGDKQAGLAMCLGRWQRAVGWRARRQAQR